MCIQQQKEKKKTTFITNDIIKLNFGELLYIEKFAAKKTQKNRKRNDSI